LFKYEVFAFQFSSICSAHIKECSGMSFVQLRWCHGSHDTSTWYTRGLLPADTWSICFTH